MRCDGVGPDSTSPQPVQAEMQQVVAQRRQQRKKNIAGSSEAQVGVVQSVVSMAATKEESNP